jgi:hypothetical protein
MFKNAISLLETAIQAAPVMMGTSAEVKKHCAEYKQAIALLRAAGDIEGPKLRYLDSVMREEIARLEGRGFSENAISLSAWKKLRALLEALPEKP